MDVSSLNEFELIARLTRNLSSRPDITKGIGDDCAILDIGGDRLLLATCDSQVEGIHFTFQTSSPSQIGRRSLAVNLSDIAAMGGEPHYALISLVLPSQCSQDVLEEIYQGLRQQAEQYATAIVGGNIASTGKSTQLIIDITLLGSVERGHALLRSGAQREDTLFVTGHPGDSAAGLYTLLHPDQNCPLPVQARLQAIHQVPTPRILEGRILSQFGPEIVTSMLDISDGISGDLAHICEQSHVGAVINVAHLPLSSDLQQLAKDTAHDPLDWVLHGGEDYELLFTVAPGYETTVMQALQSTTATPLTAIGTVVSATDGIKLLYPDGSQQVLQPHSWDHLRPPSNRGK